MDEVRICWWILEAHNLTHNDEDELYRQYIILKRVREKAQAVNDTCAFMCN